jgi:hypothetical protein
MTRRRSSTISIPVDVDIDLDKEIDDDMLLEMVRGRGLTVAQGAALEPGAMSNAELWRELADDIRAAARDQDLTHLEILLLRMSDFAGLTDFSPSTKRDISPGARR